MNPGDYVTMDGETVFWVQEVIDGDTFRALPWQNGNPALCAVHVYTRDESVRPATKSEIQEHVYGQKPPRVIGYSDFQALLEGGIWENGKSADDFAKRVFLTFQRLTPEAQAEWCAAVAAVKAEEDAG